MISFCRPKFNSVAKRFKRKYSEISEAVLDDSKRLKRSSSSSAIASSRTPTASKPTDTNIGDLPDLVLVQILCRLPSYEFVHQCKSVSKRWCTLMSDDYFVRRFIKNKETPAIVTETLISTKGEEFLNRMSSSSHKPLGMLFKKLMTLYDLKQEPFVVATFNDLVLCYAIGNNCEYYYICNPFTSQWIVLPPLPAPHSRVFEPSYGSPVGFICDVPYYCSNKDDDIIQIYAEYNCKVVRLVFPEDQQSMSSINQFKVQIFSSDTGEWRESNVSSPSEFRKCDINVHQSFACNGMLYWMSEGERDDFEFLIGLDPFMINNQNHDLQCQFIKIDKSDDYELRCLGVKGGCLMLAADREPVNTLYVCHVNVDQMARIDGKVSKEMVNKYSLEMNKGNYEHNVLAFDPIDVDVMYFTKSYGENTILSYDMRTRKWLKIKHLIQEPLSNNYFPLALPLWPTPLPRLPH